MSLCVVGNCAFECDKWVCSSEWLVAAPLRWACP